MRPSSGRAHALTLAVLGVLALATRARLVPPAPRGLDAPADAFSAARALDHVRALGGAGPPRPAGSPANLAAAERLVAAFRALGLDVQVQDAFACGPYGACARVRNVLARLGTPGPRAIAIAAHHDSVPAGPGAADDLSGVAIVLEVARAIRSGGPLPRPLVAIVTDGEELGLVGATAFAAHPWAREIGALVNLEARGTTGPSLMFETSGSPPWIGRALRRLPHPVATSAAPALYELLPNDTDLTAFAREGLAGANLAFAGGVVRYHTPEDDLAHLDRRSLQHQGENALALVRAAAAEDLDGARPARVLYFDVLGLGVVAWRGAAGPAIAAALLVALALALLGARGRLRRGEAILGLAAALAAPLAAAALLAAGWLALRPGALAFPIVASPGRFVGAAWAGGLATALLAGAAAGRRAGPAGLFAGTAVVWASLAVALAWWIPGASVLAIPPALACGLAGLAWALAPGGRGGALLAALAVGLVAGVVAFPPALLLPELLGAPSAIAIAAVVALVAHSAAPVAAGAPGGEARWLPGLVALAAAAGLVAIQSGRAPWTPAAPARLTLAYHEEAGAARWVADWRFGELPAGIRSAARFERPRERPYPWATVDPVFVAPAEPLGLALPRAEPLAVAEVEGGRLARLRLASARGAPVVMLIVPPEIRLLSATVDGVMVPPPRRRFGGNRLVGCTTTPPEGVVVELRLAGSAPATLTVMDLSLGLPPSGARLAGARPPGTVPSQDGDVTLATARVRL